MSKPQGPPSNAPSSPTLKPSKDNIDRSSWKKKAEDSVPGLQQLKQRIYPLERAISFGIATKLDLLDPKKSRMKKDDLLSKNVILQLIMQHLEFEGLKTSRKLLEKETKTPYNARPDLIESKLVTLLRMIIKDTEAVWDFTLDDKFTTSNQNLKNLQYHLVDLDLLEEESTNEQVEDVNIWQENPFNIIYDKDPKNIKAASLNQLVLRLTDTAEDYDEQLLPIFLYTYKTFTTPEKFLQKLKERYEVPKEETDKELRRNVKIRVIGVLKKWIGDHYDDFRNSDKLMKGLEEFLGNVEADNPMHAKSLLTTIGNKEKMYESSKKINRTFRDPPPEPKVSLRNIFSPKLDILDLDEEELARQLCLMEFDIYYGIKPSELYDLAWSKSQLKHRAPNVLKMIDRSTKTSQWVATMILKEDRLRNRSRLLHKFIKASEHLFQMNNFSTCMAIIAGLNTSAVHRLKFTWMDIPSNVSRTFSELQEKLDSAHAYRVYRQILASANPPCIPYLGTYLTDLTFIEEGNLNLYRGLINFHKRKLMYDVIEKVMRYQQTPYNFTSIKQIQQLLIEARKLHSLDKEDDRYALSILREPRNAERSDLIL